jgi:hypothetical protein
MTASLSEGTSSTLNGYRSALLSDFPLNMVNNIAFWSHTRPFLCPVSLTVGLGRPAELRSCRKRLRTAAVAAPERALEEEIRSSKPSVPKGLNKFSSKVTQPKSQGASQAMLYATGLREDDMDKPQVSCKFEYRCFPITY